MTTPGAGNQVKPQGQQNFMHDRVNHMTSEEAQQAPDVVLDMFLASSHPALSYSILEPLIHSYDPVLWQNIACQ
jgi:hypothetical protein